MAPPPPPPAELPDDLLGEALLRLPPDDPACLLRASLVCKRWRRILADPAFRRRRRALYPAPSVVGFLRVVRKEIPYCSRFVPDNPASGRPAARDLSGWLAVDCRHGRALFVTPATAHIDDGGEGATLDFIVWDPLTDERCRLPPPSPPPNRNRHFFNAAVLCAAASGSCDHRSCHGGPFCVAFVFTSWVANTAFTYASLYSSETGVWSRLISAQRPDVAVGPCTIAIPLVGDTLYFHACGNYVFEYQLGAQRLSVIDKCWQPEHPPWLYMASVNGKLGFIHVEKEPSLSLCLWLEESAPNGVARWARGRVINLEGLLPPLLPGDALLPPPNRPRRFKRPSIIGFAEGADVILLAVPTYGCDHDVYMADLNSGRAKKIFEDLSTVYPYTSFSIPVIDSGSTSEGPEKGASSV